MKNVEDVYPLSPMQEGLLFHTLYERKAGMYFEHVTMDLHGKFDVFSFKRAWEQVIARHPILRTIFLWEELDKPLQVVRQDVRLPWEEHDWRAILPDEQQVRLQRFFKADQERGFELSQAPLMRLSLFRLSDDTYHFIWGYHHLLLDGWSTALLFRELLLFYEAYTNQQTLSLPKPRPFREFITYLQRQQPGVAETFWRGYLKGFSAATTLSLPKPSASASGGEAGDYRHSQLTLSAEQSALLQSFARQQQVTINTVVQGAWALLLARYSGQQDVVYGTVVSGRPAELNGSAQMVGMLINTVAVRVQVRAESRVGEWLRQLQAEQVAARQYEQTPLWEVQGWSEVGKGGRLFDTIMAFENHPVSGGATNKKGPLSIRSAAHHYTRVSYPLTMIVEPGPPLILRLNYESVHYDGATIERMLGTIRHLLEEMVAGAHRHVVDLQILTEPELNHLLVELNRTDVEFPLEQCFPELFESKVAQTPDSVAAVFGSAHLTYHELNRRANRLARILVEYGVGPEVFVSILAPRGLDLLSALLATFKAGGTYLPLDPNHPPQRLRQVLDQSGAPLLLVADSLAASLSHILNELPEEKRPQVLHLEELLQRPAPEGNLQLRCGPDNLAYLMFTSGSTGVPKGAMIEHKGMLNHLFAKISDLRLTHEDTVAQNASQGFDISIWQFLAILLVGGRVQIFDDQVAHDLHQFITAVESGDVTVLETVPSLLRLMLDDLEAMPNRATFSKLRFLISNAEGLPPILCQRWFALYPHIPMVNTWGATECSDDVTHLHISGAPDGNLAYMHLGQRLANVRLYIVDRNLTPVPLGVPGELCVAGISVGRGYFNDPERTAKVFIKDPFFKGSAVRMYRTGDLARYLPDGNIEFLGRLDYQVKVRGHRIELGEIEAALRAQEGVREGVVVLDGERGGQQRLVAYVVGEEGGLLNLGAVREGLKERLPDYMVPTAYVRMERLPLNGNGKVDRRGLPAPDYRRRGVDEELAGPRTEREETLAGIWSEVLGLGEVGVHDNFFELGGDSILSIQIIARARQAGMQLSPRQLFEHQTVAELAAVAGSGEGEREELMRAPQEEVTGAVRLTPIQQWYFSLKLVAREHFNQSLMLGMAGGLERSVMAEIVGHLVAHHDALRARFEFGAGGWQQRLASVEENEGRESFAVVELKGMSEEQEREAIKEECDRWQRSLDLRAGPVCRFVYFDSGAELGGRLLVVIHHLVVDGVSWRILLEDLRELYRQWQGGEELRLGAKTNSVQQWGAYLERIGAGGGWEKEMEYWGRERGEEVKRLPVDDESGGNEQWQAGVVQRALSEERTRELVQEVPEVYRTQIQEVLLTALVLAWRRWSGRGVVQVEVEGHGREWVAEQQEDNPAAVAGGGSEGIGVGGREVDVSRTVGWFTTMYPLWLEVKEGSSAGAALKQVKEQVRRVPGRGFGYGVLKYLSPEAKVREQLGQNGQAEVLFNYLGQFEMRSGKERGAVATGGGRGESAAESQGGGAEFSVTAESSGVGRDERGERHHTLIINGVIARGRLQMEWEYSEGRQRRARVEQMAKVYEEELLKLIEHCVRPDAGGYTPSDFHLADLPQDELDKAVMEVDFQGR